METVDSIRQMIYEVRGVKVMLDADLAALYGYTTKAFNQQVKNNIAKFDDDFRFQLTKEEYREILKSKNMTSRLLLSIPESKQNNGEETMRSNFLTLENNVTGFESKNNDEGEILRSNFLTLELEQGKYSKYLPYAYLHALLNNQILKLSNK